MRTAALSTAAGGVAQPLPSRQAAAWFLDGGAAATTSRERNGLMTWELLALILMAALIAGIVFAYSRTRTPGGS